MISLRTFAHHFPRQWKKEEQGEEKMRQIPQRPPMVMIDEGLACDDRHIVTGFRVDTGNVFGQHGILTEPGLIENITQAAAS